MDGRGRENGWAREREWTGEGERMDGRGRENGRVREREWMGEGERMVGQACATHGLFNGPALERIEQVCERELMERGRESEGEREREG